MLSAEEKKKGAIMAAIRCGETDEHIVKRFKIYSGTLTAYKSEYEAIKEQLEQMKAVSEIAEELDHSDEFVGEIKRIVETDVETLVTEALARDEKEEPEHEPEPEAPEQPGKGKKGKGKGDPKPPKNIDSKLKSTAMTETAEVLVGDAGDIGKAVAVERQDIGKFVQETMATVAMQFGFKNHKEFLLHVYEFWLQYQGRVQEMEEHLAEMYVVNRQLQETLDQDIIGMYILKSLERVAIATAMGGGALDYDTLLAYKQVLITDPAFLRELRRAITADVTSSTGRENETEVEAYAQ